MRVLRQETGLGIVDTLVVIVIISVLIGVLIPKYQETARKAQEVALQMGLGNIRKAIQLYVLTKQEIPRDLGALMEHNYLSPTADGTIFEQAYLVAIALDDKGQPSDPFGNAYRYDPKTGLVHSTTPGYENW